MAKATLGGYALLNGPLSWAMTSGVDYFKTEMETWPENADALTRGPLRPVTLEIETPGAKGVQVQFLYVLQQRPAANPETRMLLVVDRRWFWTYSHANHTFNARRTVGYKRVKAGFDEPAIDPVVASVQYGKWSMKGGAPWSAKDALERVWETVKEPERETSGAAPRLIVDSEIGKLTGRTLPMEDVELADTAAGALQRILNFIPGAQITVEADGTCRVYSIASGAEAGILDAMLPEQDGAHAMPISYARQRPREVRVFFAPEFELRLDYEEVGTGQTAEAMRSTDLEVENVAPVPDYSLTVGGTEYAMGTWLRINSLLTGWNSEGSGVTLSTDAIRHAMAPGMDLWTAVQIAGLGAAKAVWAQRIGAIQAHWRRTYRINPDIMARLRSVRAYRTATIDPATGSRAPATAYQDWSAVATQRFLAIQLAKGGASFQYAENFDGYPKGGLLAQADKKGTAKAVAASPIDVTVVDPDQGIIALDLRPGPFRESELLLPSKIDNIPTGDLKFGLIAWNSIEAGRSPPALSATHKTIIVVTVVPGGPNSKERLFQMTRKPTDVASILPSALSAGLNEAHGPPMDVFVGPGWEVARVAWADRQANRIKKAMGLGSDEAKGSVSDLADLVTNVAAQKAFGNSAASLDAIANSIAASVYAGFSDRVEGKRTSPVTHAAQVLGFVESVMHRVLPDGEASSTVSIMGQRSPLDLMSMLPHSTRAIMLQLATSSKAV